jgi:hypothetical protein
MVRRRAALHPLAPGRGRDRPRRHRRHQDACPRRSRDGLSLRVQVARLLPACWPAHRPIGRVLRTGGGASQVHSVHPVRSRLTVEGLRQLDPRQSRLGADASLFEINPLLDDAMECYGAGACPQRADHHGDRSRRLGYAQAGRCLHRRTTGPDGKAQGTEVPERLRSRRPHPAALTTIQVRRTECSQPIAMTVGTPRVCFASGKPSEPESEESHKPRDGWSRPRLLQVVADYWRLSAALTTDGAGRGRPSGPQYPGVGTGRGPLVMLRPAAR